VDAGCHLRRPWRADLALAVAGYSPLPTSENPSQAQFAERVPSKHFVNKGKKEAGTAGSPSLLDSSNPTLTASVP
jgi:hypothetical protein